MQYQPSKRERVDREMFLVILNYMRTFHSATHKDRSLTEPYKTRPSFTCAVRNTYLETISSVKGALITARDKTRQFKFRPNWVKQKVTASHTSANTPNAA